MSAIIHERPVAVLMPFDGEPIIVPVPEPPSPEFLLAVRQPFSASIDASLSDLPTVRLRRFLFEPTMRAKDHRWMRVDNDGRSQTPEDGYVYFEVR